MAYYKDIITAIQGVALRYKGVRTSMYQSDDLNNTTGNFKAIQVYIDDVTRSDMNITTNVFKVELNIMILKQPSYEEGNTILDVQDECYLLACNLLDRIDRMPEYMGIMQVHDYSIITVSHVTDDDAAGVRLTLVLSMPNPVNLCDESDYWNDEPYSGDTEYDVDVPYDEPDKLDINPISLPKNPIRC